MKTFITLTLTLILFTTHVQTPLAKEFTDLLNRAGMQFTAPKGFKQVAPVKKKPNELGTGLQAPSQKV